MSVAADIRKTMTLVYHARHVRLVEALQRVLRGEALIFKQYGMLGQRHDYQRYEAYLSWHRLKV